MYFDPKPKRRREDLYDRERELEEFQVSLEEAPMTVVTGIRRLGKTSLILVGLEGRPHIFIDFRGVPQSRRAIYRRIESALNEFFRQNRDVWRRVRDALRAVSGVELFGVGVSLSWKRGETDLPSLLRSLEDYGVVLVFDEVQHVRGPYGRELAETLAYLYDHSNIKMVLSGSEVGVLYDFIGVMDASAPLYGRYFREVKLSPFTRSQSIDFLYEGFRQVGVRPERSLVEEAVDAFDGVVGWLVYFGLRYLERRGDRKVVSEILEEAGRLSLSEFTGFLRRHRPAEKRMLEMAKAIARGAKTWSQIKEYLERREGRSIPEPTMARLLKALVRSSYVRKTVDGRNVFYEIADPTLKHALSKL